MLFVIVLIICAILCVVSGIYAFVELIRFIMDLKLGSN